jgi:phosphoglycolate phosphatase-like HAD superfamily hydrolase
MDKMGNQHGIIFLDIDGTLLHSGGAGLKAFNAAINEVFGIDFKFHRNHFAGALDPLIFETVLKTLPPAVQKERDRHFPRFKTRYLELLAQAPASQYTIYPGVVDFLKKYQPHYYLGVITGNFQAGAEIKMDNCGLRKYFTVGGYGENGANRGQVAAHALGEANRMYHTDFKRVYVIGDTAHDVTCGQAIGARTIAVRTGFNDLAELEKARPDLIVENLVGLDLEVHFP